MSEEAPPLFLHHLLPSLTIQRIKKQEYSPLTANLYPSQNAEERAAWERGSKIFGHTKGVGGIAG